MFDIFPAIIAVQSAADLIGRGVHVFHGYIMVHKIDDGGNKLAHVGLQIIGPGFKFRRMIVEIGGDQSLKVALFVSLVKGLNTVGK